jgi:hypothetical protein
MIKIKPLPWSQGYEYQIEPGKPYPLRLLAYNFADESVKGTVKVVGKPSGWVLDRERWTVSVDSMGRERFEATLTIPADQAGSLRLTGDFGPVGKAALAFNVQSGKDEK